MNMQRVLSEKGVGQRVLSEKGFGERNRKDQQMPVDSYCILMAYYLSLFYFRFCKCHSNNVYPPPGVCSPHTTQTGS
jgi:hypothetical protein